MLVSHIYLIIILASKKEKYCKKLFIKFGANKSPLINETISMKLLTPK